ncbi:transposase, partial [Candidatus Peregrinibacteria bacterium]|nr:transposase [Candidatus Peregrinibacteria bacterium]
MVYAKTTVLVVLGIDKKGNKKALGAWEGSSENSRVCIDLLQSLVDRGFNLSACKLAVIDGGKALRKALDEVFGKDMLIQRCQVHKKRNVTDYLPKEKRETVKRAISEAYNAENYDAAKKLL